MYVKFFWRYLHRASYPTQKRPGIIKLNIVYLCPPLQYYNEIMA